MIKNKNISLDLKQFNEILKLVPDNKKAVAKSLITEITFMSKTLDELKKAIEKTGAVDLFKQGKQEFFRENPALKAYNTTIQRYSLLYKQLCDMLPKQQKETVATSELYKFIGNDNL